MISSRASFRSETAARARDAPEHMTDDHSKPESVLCCFCGEALPAADAVLLEVYPTSDRRESQALYAHRGHLVARIVAGIPLHPDLTTDPRG